MAHWLYCMSCQQWSRSATPLTEDKVCKFCGSMLKKTKAGSSQPPQVNEEVKEEKIIPVDDVVEEIESEAAAEAAAVDESEGPDQLEEAEESAPELELPKIEEAEEQPEETVAAEDEEVLAEEVEEADGSDVVKVSEVRVITDKSEKKERLAKKRH